MRCVVILTSFALLIAFANGVAQDPKNIGDNDYYAITMPYNPSEPTLISTTSAIPTSSYSDPYNSSVSMVTSPVITGYQNHTYIYTYPSPLEYTSISPSQTVEQMQQL